MQNLTDWSINKALPIFCLVIICVICPGVILYWNAHPAVTQQVRDSESSIASGGQSQDLTLPDNSVPPPLPPGTPAVDFVSTTVNGASYVFDSHSPNIKIVEFWATWCGPCHMSIPALEDLAATLKPDGVDVIGVSVDTNTANQVKPFAAAMHMNYTVLVDPHNNPLAQENYNAQGLPSLYIIDGKGIVRWSFSGYWPGEEPYVRQIISNLLSGMPVGLP
jgi:thiol-disulfide isomerase/thioredoxin